MLSVENDMAGESKPWPIANGKISGDIVLTEDHLWYEVVENYLAMVNRIDDGIVTDFFRIFNGKPLRNARDMIEWVGRRIQLKKAEGDEPGEEPEKLEPGDIDPETGEEVPEEEEPEEEEEEEPEEE